MSTPITSYSVTTPSATAAVVVPAQSFTTLDGILVFLSASNQTVAAFAPSAWSQVLPVVTP